MTRRRVRQWYKKAWPYAYNHHPARMTLAERRRYRAIMREYLSDTYNVSIQCDRTPRFTGALDVERVCCEGCLYTRTCMLVWAGDKERGRLSEEDIGDWLCVTCEPRIKDWLVLAAMESAIPK